MRFQKVRGIPIVSFFSREILFLGNDKFERTHDFGMQLDGDVISTEGFDFWHRDVFFVQRLTGLLENGIDDVLLCNA